MPLILTQNEVTVNDAHDWKDIEGEQYHYPTKYRNKIKEGERFIYYQGVNRAGGKKGEAHYFGTGRIGTIWQDPDPERQKGGKIAWFCPIEDYERFPVQVLAKVDGVNREQGPANLFRDGVRVTDDETFDGILEASGISLENGPIRPTAIPPKGSTASRSENLLVPRKKNGGGGTAKGRYSRNAKAIGDWAEELVLQLLKEIDGSSEHVHRAAIGETPGWDLDYLRPDGTLQRIEVKGTQAAAFRHIEITANEWDAAVAQGDGYSLCLVARCMSDNPSYQFIQNPAQRLADQGWIRTPTTYRIEF